VKLTNSMMNKSECVVAAAVTAAATVRLPMLKNLKLVGVESFKPSTPASPAPPLRIKHLSSPASFQKGPSFILLTG